MKYQIIALDLDGTLLTSQKQILPESLNALAQARRQGVKVVIATGRHHVAIHPFYQALDLDTPAICCNGTYAYHYQNQRVLSGSPLSKEQALHLAKRLREHPIRSLLYVDGAMQYERHDEAIGRWQAWASRLPEHQRPVIEQVESYEAAIERADNVWKFATVCDDAELLSRFSDQIEQELGLTCERSWHNQIDMAQRGNSKGSRLQEWVMSLGLSMDNVIAFGDNLNDISMLSQAGLGVAMGNSSDEVKAAADMVTTENEHHSIAEVIKQHVLMG